MDNEKFRPTTEWMQENYDRLNRELFNGELMECELRPFTSGKGSQGGTLGWFKLLGDNLKYDKNTRKIFVKNIYFTTFITKSNFVQLAKPCIELNANYTWSEHAMLATLAHEMCHYYTYMYGKVPRQAHGREFKSIGAIISERSKGMFTIQRLASAEQMSEMELDQEMKDKKEKRLSNKKSAVKGLFVYKDDGKIEMSLTSKESLIDYILQYNAKQPSTMEVIESNDSNLIDLIFNDGYRKNFRTYRYWTIENKPWANTIKDYDYRVLFSRETANEVEKNVGSIPMENKIPLFLMHTMSGKEVKLTNTTKEEIREKLKEIFPSWSETAIENVMNNEKFYPTKSVDEAISKALNNFLLREFKMTRDNLIKNNTREITQDMNLGVMDME